MLLPFDFIAWYKNKVDKSGKNAYSTRDFSVLKYSYFIHVDGVCISLEAPLNMLLTPYVLPL